MSLLVLYLLCAYVGAWCSHYGHTFRCASFWALSVPVVVFASAIFFLARGGQ